MYHYNSIVCRNIPVVATMIWGCMFRTLSLYGTPSAKYCYYGSHGNSRTYGELSGSLLIVYSSSMPPECRLFQTEAAATSRISMSHTHYVRSNFTLVIVPCTGNLTFLNHEWMSKDWDCYNADVTVVLRELAACHCFVYCSIRVFFVRHNTATTVTDAGTTLRGDAVTV